MNIYSFNDIEIGSTEKFSTKITEDMMRSFLSITGDVNPLHTDHGFACSKGYHSNVVYGMLTASFYSTLGGVYLPGKKCLLQSVDSKFVRPVYINDELHIEGVVVEKLEGYNCIKINAKIRNQNSEIVSKAVIIAKVADE